MRPIKLALLLALTSLRMAHAQEARFFRVTGPVATTITSLTADGYVTWTNAPTNATFTVQTALSLVGPSNWVDYIQVPVTNPVTTHRLYDSNPPSGMSFIPAGSFTMGDSLDGDEVSLPLHTVYVSAFYMDRYEVTKALWDDVYNWATNHGYSFDYANSGQGKTNNHPAHSMTWHDAVKWCNARSEKEGRVPAYYTSAGQTNAYQSGQTNLQNDWVKWNEGYRLPTEAEWEKGARGGVAGLRFPWGNTITHSQANYGLDPAFTGTSPAGYFAPNGYGLYDMAGNVWEWCWDWYSYYSSSPSTDPRGPAPNTGRVLRGGSYGHSAFLCRPATRYYANPLYRDYNKGFRSVLPSVP